MRVKLYAHGVDDGSSIRQEMKQRVRQLAGATGDYVYRATVSTIRAATDYTARVIPTAPAWWCLWNRLYSVAAVIQFPTCR